MAEAAINLAFLGATTYIVGRDIYGYLPTFGTTSPIRQKRRFRGDPSATQPMDDETCDPAALPPRTSRGPRLAGPARAAVKECCESLLEAKYIQESVSGTVPSVTAVPRVTCLNDLGQGTSADTRVGNKILMKSLQVEGILYIDPGDQSDWYRMVVVMDHECYGSICTWGQYVQGTPLNRIYSLPSVETVGKGKRFTTLVDKLIPIQRPDQTNVGPPSSSLVVQSFSFKVPLSASAMYSGNAGTISDIVRNSVCFIEASGNGRVKTEWQSRLVFLDG